MTASPVTTIGLEPERAYFPREKLVPSLTNPRKRKGLDIASLTELAQTMRPPIGMLQPILARWIKKIIDGIEVDLLEIIAGERRWRASEIALLPEVPVIVRNLSDVEVLKIQLIENKQREDLDELEEAEGYEKLMKEVDSEGKPYTAERIADAMGVSRGTIYGRLILLKLCQEGRDAFYAGELDASTAQIIARIPVKKLQLEALKEVTRGRNSDNPSGGWMEGDKAMSFRAARALLQEHFMLDLAKAPFDIKDVDLVPKVGSCMDCGYRTGNQPDIFDDVTSKDVCTDPTCHAIKKTAHVLALQKKYEKNGSRLVVGKEAKKLIPNYMNSPKGHLEERGYVPLDNKVPGDEQNRTWKQLLKEKKLIDAKGAEKPAVIKTVVENPRNPNELIETVSIEEAVKKLREIAGYEVAMKTPAKPANKKDSADKEKAKERVQITIADQFRSRLFDTLHQRIETETNNPETTVFPALYAILAEQYWDDLSHLDAVVIARKFMGFKAGETCDEGQLIDAFQKQFHTMTMQQHFLLMVDAFMATDLGASEWNYTLKPDSILSIAKAVGIDSDAMHKEVEIEIKEVEKAAQEAAKAAKKTASKEAAKKLVDTAFSTLKTTLTPKPAAQQKVPEGAGEAGAVAPAQKAKRKAAVAA